MRTDVLKWHIFFVAFTNLGTLRSGIIGTSFGLGPGVGLAWPPPGTFGLGLPPLRTLGFGEGGSTFIGELQRLELGVVGFWGELGGVGERGGGGGGGFAPPPLVLSPPSSTRGKMCGGQNDLLMIRLSVK